MAKMTAQSLTITVAPSPATANYSSPSSGRVIEDHIGTANRHQQRHSEEHRALWRQLEAIRTLFGRGLSAILEEHAENAAEHSSEESYHLRQHITEQGRQHEAAIWAERSRSSELAVELARARQLLREVFDYETTPRRARANRPEWTGKVASYLDESTTQSEPF